MPTYSYRCTECDTAFDIQQAFTDHSLTECPSCGGRLRKVFSSIGVTFNGSGFYRNDARAAAKSAQKAGQKAEQKAGQKADQKSGDKADQKSGDKSGQKSGEKSSTPAVKETAPSAGAAKTTHATTGKGAATPSAA